MRIKTLEELKEISGFKQLEDGSIQLMPTTDGRPYKVLPGMLNSLGQELKPQTPSKLGSYQHCMYWFSAEMVTDKPLPETKPETAIQYSGSETIESPLILAKTPGMGLGSEAIEVAKATAELAVEVTKCYKPEMISGPRPSAVVNPHAFYGSEICNLVNGDCEKCSHRRDCDVNMMSPQQRKLTQYEWDIHNAHVEAFATLECERHKQIEEANKNCCAYLFNLSSCTHCPYELECESAQLDDCYNMPGSALFESQFEKISGKKDYTRAVTWWLMFLGLITLAVTLMFIL